jgi:hypothetical protein
MKYVISYSLTSQHTVKAGSLAEAESKLGDYLRDNRINLVQAKLRINSVKELKEDE